MSYRFLISFFDRMSKNWLGDTFEGPLHEPDQPEISVYSSSMQNLFFFLTQDGDNVKIVLELTLVGLQDNPFFILIYIKYHSATDNLNRVVMEAGLGWTYINLID